VVRDNVQSSLIAARGYSPETRTLELEFHGNKPDLPKKVYRYTPFTPERWAEFKAADSVGRYFLQKIKTDKSLTVQRVEEVDAISEKVEEKNEQVPKKEATDAPETPAATPQDGQSQE
jgi:KTSC domain